MATQLKKAKPTMPEDQKTAQAAASATTTGTAPAPAPKRARYVIENGKVKKDDKGNNIETKFGKFARLAEARTKDALDAIARLRNLSNTSVYDYNDADVGDMLKALEDAVDKVGDTFKKGAPVTDGFAFRD